MARRSTRPGALYRYKTKAGIRWRWQLYVPVDPAEPDGAQRRIGGSGFRSPDDAQDALNDAVKARKNNEEFASGQAPTLEAFSARWLEGLRLAPSTVQGYRRLVRNHVVPQLGGIRVDRLTATRLARHYRELEASGRRDARGRGEPLSANTVNKVHVVVGAMLDAAIDDGLITQNPARKSRTVKAPTGKQIRDERPEIVTWTGHELRAFLEWDRDVFDDELFPLWRAVAWTGMRRSEALALRWSDIDFRGQRISVRRAADPANRHATKTTKTSRARVVDIDDETTAVLRAYRALRGTISLELARADAYTFGNLEGQLRSPNEISRRWRYRVEAAQRDLPDLPTITLKGLRHTHATLLLELGQNPKIVQERLGHSTITTTMNVYSHVTPTMQRSAVDLLERHIRGA